MLPLKSSTTLLFSFIFSIVAQPTKIQTETSTTTRDDVNPWANVETITFAEFEAQIDTGKLATSTELLSVPQPKSRSSEKFQSVFHFACPYHGDGLTRTFMWGVTYDPFKGVASYSKGLNVDYFSQDEQSGWNPLDFSAVWNHRVCVKMDDTMTDCFYHFWQHFYGTGTSDRISATAPSNVAAKAPMRPGITETCVPRGNMPTDSSPTSNCLIYGVFVSTPKPKPKPTDEPERIAA